MANEYDLIIVGMGSGGMVAAEFAATLDLKIAAVERDRMGGDCLWTGCVPSKALLASAKVAHHMRTADHYGIAAVEPQVNGGRVWDRIRTIQQEIAQTDDNPERYEEMGVEFHWGPARLTGPHTVQVGDGDELRGRFILLCTGSRPVVPPIEGLQDADFMTSASLWDLEDAPQSLVAIGGGPISVEMSQAFNRLGIEVHTLQKGPEILPRDEPALVEILVDRLRSEGLDLAFNVETQRVTVEDGVKVVHGTQDGEPRTWRGQ